MTTATMHAGGGEGYVDDNTPYVGGWNDTPGSPGGGSDGGGGSGYAGGGGGSWEPEPWYVTTDDGITWNCLVFLGYAPEDLDAIWGGNQYSDAWLSVAQAYDLCFAGGGEAVEEVTLTDRIQGCLDGDRKPVDVPEPGVGVNPALGLTGLETYFWALNYRDNEPVYGEVHLGVFCGLDVTVETRLTPVYYYFSYGDGYYTDGTTSGVPWPVPSEYRHVYERTGRYPVTVRVTLAFAWRLPGGAWQEAGRVTRESTIEYPVQQLQSVITQ
ncbi:MAG TPA: PKD domain-containing protein [Dehalococcoidia bacterium]